MIKEIKNHLSAGLAIIGLFAMIGMPTSAQAKTSESTAQGRAALQACAHQYRVALPLPQQISTSTKLRLRSCVMARGYAPPGYKKQQAQIAACTAKQGVTLPEGERAPANDHAKEVIRQCRGQYKTHS